LGFDVTAGLKTDESTAVQNIWYYNI